MDPPLELVNAIGISGNVASSLLLHEADDAAHIVYPLGSTLVIRNVEDASDQIFLRGQRSHMGFLADVIVWDTSDIKAPAMLHKLSLHKVGGQDDNNLVIWDVATGMAICGSPASHDATLVVAWHNTTPFALVTGGLRQLRTWSFDAENRKVRPKEVFTGKEVRDFISVTMDPSDAFLYAGTKSGDVIKVETGSKRMVTAGPRKRLKEGVSSIQYNAATNQLLVGSGAGELAVLSTEELAPLAFTNVMGGVASLALDSHGEFFFAGTVEANLYLVQYDGLVAELKGTSHASPITDVVFPRAYSELFASCGGSDIRVWHAASLSELLRIQVPNVTCNAIAFPPDGTSILSGWSDGKVRSFGPQSGNLKYVINDAHRLTGMGNTSGGTVQINGVTAITPTNDGRRLLTGGADGKVRVWAVSKAQQVMVASMQEHKGPIFSIAIRANDSECVSASADGSCIVWALAGLTPYTRVGVLFAPQFFKCAVYLPDESQILTCGTDRKVTYWDSTDFSQIRVVDASEEAEMTSLHISGDGTFFASGSADRRVKLWSYDEGVAYCVGNAHSSAVAAIKISPDEQTVVSVGREGGINIWRVPEGMGAA